jgi:hypothetical protein
MLGSVIFHTIEKHETDKVLNSKEGEGVINSARNTGESLLSHIHPWMVIVGGILLVLAFTAYSVAGKGRGSHAGREEVRRSYRRELAKQMARQDAEKIKSGEKVRRKWMQW